VLPTIPLAFLYFVFLSVYRITVHVLFGLVPFLPAIVNIKIAFKRSKTLVNFFLDGRAIAQAVSRWLPTAAARVRALVWSSGICGGQNGAGAGFLRVLRFPLPIFIPPILHNHPHLSSGAVQ
jgi:hypothetical protein